MNKLSKEDRALMQARHLINEIEQGSISGELMTLKVSPWAYGYFKNAVLKALRDRKDLHERSPEIFGRDKPCVACEGTGRIPIPEDHADYTEHLNSSIEHGDGFKAGDKLYWICKLCEGNGVLIK